MREITNPHSGDSEWIINKEEKDIIDIALHNLAVSTGNASLTSVRGGEHD